MTSIQGVVHGQGEGTGPALVLDEPLSFWGGVDPETGEIIDRNHPQSGRSISGMVLILGHARGSSGTPSVLAESVRNGSGPAAVILREADPMFAVGSAVITELYPDKTCPVVVVGDSFGLLGDGRSTTVGADGTVIQEG